MKKYLRNDAGNLFGYTLCKRSIAGRVDYGEDKGDYFLKQGRATLVPFSRVPARMREDLYYLKQYDIRP